MKIFVTGGNGQVGNALQRVLGDSGHEATFTDVDDLNLTDTVAVERYLLDLKPELVVNCAAYTAVDKAESEPERARDINAQAVYVLAKACQLSGAHLVQLSSDYVYHNGLCRPMKETDMTNPQSVYALTKLEGDRLAQQTCLNTTILRTSWVYGLEGHNFVRTMIRLGQEREQLSVVFDQIGAPTFAEDIARAVLEIATQIDAGTWKHGVFNYAGGGTASWYDFARHIMLAYNIDCEINPITTSEYPTPARRPPYSLMNLSAARKAGLPVRHWEDAFAEFKERDATT